MSGDIFTVQEQGTGGPRTKEPPSGPREKSVSLLSPGASSADSLAATATAQIKTNLWCPLFELLRSSTSHSPVEQSPIGDQKEGGRTNEQSSSWNWPFGSLGQINFLPFNPSHRQEQEEVPLRL